MSLTNVSPALLFQQKKSQEIQRYLCQKNKSIQKISFSLIYIDTLYISHKIEVICFLQNKRGTILVFEKQIFIKHVGHISPYGAILASSGLILSQSSNTHINSPLLSIWVLHYNPFQSSQGAEDAGVLFVLFL